MEKDYIIFLTLAYTGIRIGELCAQNGKILIKFVENRMSRLLKLAQLNDGLTPHSLRHTHTSLLAEAGVGLPEIMDRLGHVDDATTRNVYLHVTKTKKKEASQKFSELMRDLKTIIFCTP